MGEEKSLYRLSSYRGLVVCLYMVAGISAAVGIFVGIGLFLQAAQDARDSLEIFARGLSAIVQGLVFGCLLWAVGRLLRQREAGEVLQRQSLRLLDELSRHRQADKSTEDSSASAAAAAWQEESLQKILHQLTELNANLLLSGQQRRARRRQMQQEQADRLVQQIDLAQEQNDYDAAEQLCRRLRQEAPEDSRIDALAERIQQRRQKYVQEMLAGQVQRVTDLMSVSRFEDALGLAEEVRRHHPNAPEADELLGRVQREAATFHTEQRRRLMAIIQEHAEARRWKEALAAAHRLLKLYANAPEADHVRSMMPTLVDNARIQEVREHRDRFVDLIERRRFSEALDVARGVVENYPETGFAEEARAQLPRLRELAQAE